MDVFALTSGGRELASTRYRVFYLEPLLQERGVQYTVKEHQGLPGSKRLGKVGDALGLARNLFHATRNDLVLVQKVRLSEFHLDRLRQANEHIVYDLDDAMYATPPWRSEDDAEARRQRVDRVLERVSHVIVGNPELADYASPFCDDILLAPTALPRERYESYHESAPSDDGPLIVGWIGNEQNLWYLEQIEEQLEQFLSERDDVELQIVTSQNHPRTPLANRVGDDVRYVEWSEERELEFLDRFDVGIRPLTDDEFTRSKGGFTSVIQCMATATPVVVSPVGMLEDIVEHGESGFHATEPGDWISYLHRLADDPDQRRRMGDRAFDRVGEERFWTDQRVEDLVEFYRSILQET